MFEEENIVKTRGFTKGESLALKAVAVLMIIMHHSISGNSVYGGFTLNFFPFSESQINHIGAYCKICVGIFAFITGYGITKKYCCSPKTASQQAFSQYFHSIKNFWPVFVVCLFITAIIDGRPFTVYAGQSFLHSLVNLLLDGLGVARLMGTPNLDGSWWYLSAMTVFAFVVPLFWKMLQHMGWLISIFFLFALPRLIGMGYLPYGDIMPFYFLMAVLLGAIFSKYNLFEYIDSIDLTSSKTLNKLLRVISAGGGDWG